MRAIAEHFRFCVVTTCRTSVGEIKEKWKSLTCSAKCLRRRWRGVRRLAHIHRAPERNILFLSTSLTGFNVLLLLNKQIWCTYDPTMNSYTGLFICLWMYWIIIHSRKQSITTHNQQQCKNLRFRLHLENIDQRHCGGKKVREQNHVRAHHLLLSLQWPWCCRPEGPRGDEKRYHLSWRWRREAFFFSPYRGV